MKRLLLIFWLQFISFLHTSGEGTPSGSSLIADARFQRGFELWETRPGMHISYGQLRSFQKGGTPVWGLSQWSSKFPLSATNVQEGTGSLLWSNAAKSIRITAEGSISLRVNSAVEYGAKAREVSDPWVHLLLEQEFGVPAKLSELSSATLHLEARLLHSIQLHQGDYSPARHAAQFQLFFTIQNRNKQSRGFGDLVWFGVPIYDNRDRFAKAFKAQDFGGTAKYIFTPGGETFTKESTHDGKWITIDKDLLPLMKEGLQSAWASGFLKDSKVLNDYYIGGMNMGWELPGTFDVEMEVKDLSLEVSCTRTY